MARIRSIHPGFFTDEGVVAVSPLARVLLLGLGVEADDKGTFPWKLNTIKMRLLPVDNIDVGELLQELLDEDLIQRYEDGGKPYGAIRNFRKHQRPKTPNDVHPAPNHIRKYVGLPVDDSETEVRKQGQFPQKGEKPIQMEDVGGRMKDEGGKKVFPPPVREREARPAQHEDVGTQEQFDEFWAVYPNPTQRPSAQGNFQFACMKASPATIIAAARAYANKTDDRPWMNPAKWLAEECWNDQPAKPIPKQNRPRPQTRRDEAIEDFLRNDDANENGRQSENDAGGYVLELPSKFGS